jgi:DNA-binding NarL/FixJ family response regulator
MIKVALIEDNVSYRKALKIYIQTVEDITIVYEGPSVKEMLSQLSGEPADVIIMDINLGPESGIEGVKQIRNLWPNTGIFMLTVFEDEEKITQSIRAGAVGYLLKKDPPEKVIEAIKTVYNGEGVINGKIARVMFEHYSRSSNESPSFDDYDITKREKEIIDLLLKGLSYKEIAASLFISVDTLNSHIRKIYSKLNVHSRSEIAARFR